jgi:septal ring factor EnvC (AmiA/AmiB activator)
MGFADMDNQLAQLQRNIARVSREIRVQTAEMQSLIEVDIDCTE